MVTDSSAEVSVKDSKIDGIPLVCQRCGHKWVYHGKSDWYTSCGKCKAMVNVRKKKIKLGVLKVK